MPSFSGIPSDLLSVQFSLGITTCFLVIFALIPAVLSNSTSLMGWWWIDYVVHDSAWNQSWVGRHLLSLSGKLLWGLVTWVMKWGEMWFLLLFSSWGCFCHISIGKHYKRLFWIGAHLLAWPCHFLWTNLTTLLKGVYFAELQRKHT